MKKQTELVADFQFIDKKFKNAILTEFSDLGDN